MLADMVRTLPTRDAYDLWSEVFDRDGNPLIALEERHIDALIGPVAGLTVADGGCGTGRHAIRLAAAGARVTALDFSPGMLAAAQGNPGPSGCASGGTTSPTRCPSTTPPSIASCAAWWWNP